MGKRKDKGAAGIPTGAGIEFNPIPRVAKRKEPEQRYNMGIHAVNQFFAKPKNRTLFSEEKVEEFVKATGYDLLNKPEGYGVFLNVSQGRVLDGILKAFSETKYKGQRTVSKVESLKESYSKGKEKLSKVYANIQSIPVIRLSQAEIIKAAGYDTTNQKHKKDAVEGLTHLATAQYCFYWERLVKDERGNPLKNKNGDYRKEEVMEVGTLFRVSEIREGERVYYEIHPSAVMLDQVNSDYGGPHFLPIPYDWRRDIKRVTGKTSKYTEQFLLWLRQQAEELRRKKKPLEIRYTWEEIAEILKMPETLRKRNRKRAEGLITNAYDAAIKLNYLTKVDRGVADTLHLNKEFYPKPQEEIPEEK